MAGGMTLGTEIYRNNKMVTYIGVVGEGDDRRLIHTTYGDVAKSVEDICDLSSHAKIFEFEDIDERRGFIGQFENYSFSIRKEALKILDTMQEFIPDNQPIAA